MYDRIMNWSVNIKISIQTPKLNNEIGIIGFEQPYRIKENVLGCSICNILIFTYTIYNII